MAPRKLSPCPTSLAPDENHLLGNKIVNEDLCVLEGEDGKNHMSGSSHRWG